MCGRLPATAWKREMWHTIMMSDTGIVEVGPKGRVVIPAAIRKRLGIEPGTRLTVLVDGEAVVLVPRTAVERRLQSIFKGVPTSMANELVGERRAEAEADL
jgi:AbrB family looped-hinge helix DNA binding protein